MYSSPANQGPIAFQDKGHTFSQLVVLDDGSCVAAEGRGARDIGAGGLVVHYPNPFKAGGAPRILFEAKTRIVGVARDRTGAWHAVSSKTVHRESGGAWTTKTPKLSGFMHLSRIIPVDDEVVVKDFKRCLRGGGKVWSEVAFYTTDELFVDGPRILVIGRREDTTSDPCSLY